jgi:hypothetical protein
MERLGEETNGFLSQEKKFLTFSTLRGDFQGGTKGRRNAIRPSPSPLEPPLEVLETFGGAKVSDDDQLKTERETPKYSDSHDCYCLNRKNRCFTTL